MVLERYSDRVSTLDSSLMPGKLCSSLGYALMWLAEGGAAPNAQTDAMQPPSCVSIA